MNFNLKRILPNRSEHVLLTSFKITWLLILFVFLVSVVILSTAGGHPPGIALVPLILFSLIMIVVVSIAAFFGLTIFIPKQDMFGPTPTRYPTSVLLSGVYFLLILMSSLSALMPGRIIGSSFNPALYSLAVAILSYAILIGIGKRKKWARIAAIIALLLPMLLIAYSVVFVLGGRHGFELNFSTLFALLPFALSTWIIIEYVINPKVKAFFSC